MRNLTVALVDLPEVARAALKSVGYSGSDIWFAIAADNKVSLHSNASGDGCRSFTTVIDLSTGRYETTWGSWGGSNMFVKTVVDDCQQLFEMNFNCMVIKGTIGGNTRSWGTVYLRSDNVIKGLLDAATISEREYVVLHAQSRVGAYKKEYLSRNHVTEEELQNLVKAGYLSKVGRGLGLTVKGKNAMAKFETENPGKRIW